MLSNPGLWRLARPPISARRCRLRSLEARSGGSSSVQVSMSPGATAWKGLAQAVEGRIFARAARGALDRGTRLTYRREMPRTPRSSSGQDVSLSR